MNQLSLLLLEKTRGCNRRTDNLPSPAFLVTACVTEKRLVPETSVFQKIFSCWVHGQTVIGRGGGGRALLIMLSRTNMPRKMRTKSYLHLATWGDRSNSECFDTSSLVATYVRFRLEEKLKQMTKKVEYLVVR